MMKSMITIKSLKYLQLAGMEVIDVIENRSVSFNKVPNWVVIKNVKF